MNIFVQKYMTSRKSPPNQNILVCKLTKGKKGKKDKKDKKGKKGKKSKKDQG